MKCKLLALTLCLASLSCKEIKANNSNLQAEKRALSKGKSNATFFAASDNTPLFFPETASGLETPTAPYVIPLTFTQAKHSQGKGIKASPRGDYFLLDEGSYLVLFTGTFSTNQPAADFDVALQLGSDVIFDNFESLLGESTSMCLTNLYKVVEVKERTTLSVVVQNEFEEFFDAATQGPAQVPAPVPQPNQPQPENSFVPALNALTRSITIIKLS